MPLYQYRALQERQRAVPARLLPDGVRNPEGVTSLEASVTVCVLLLIRQDHSAGCAIASAVVLTDDEPSCSDSLASP